MTVMTWFSSNIKPFVRHHNSSAPNSTPVTWGGWLSNLSSGELGQKSWGSPLFLWGLFWRKGQVRDFTSRFACVSQILNLGVEKVRFSPSWRWPVPFGAGRLFVGCFDYLGFDLFLILETNERCERCLCRTPFEISHLTQSRDLWFKGWTTWKTRFLSRDGITPESSWIS